MPLQSPSRKTIGRSARNGAHADARGPHLATQLTQAGATQALGDVVTAAVGICRVRDVVDRASGGRPDEQALALRRRGIGRTGTHSQRRRGGGEGAAGRSATPRTDRAATAAPYSDALPVGPGHTPGSAVGVSVETGPGSWGWSPVCGVSVRLSVRRVAVAAVRPALSVAAPVAAMGILTLLTFHQ